jgi:hypothetical protein
MSDVQGVIERAWDQRDAISSATRGEIRDAVAEALAESRELGARVRDFVRRRHATDTVVERLEILFADAARERAG